MLKENGIDLDTIYECVGNEQIYWIKEKTRVPTKKEIKEEIEDMQTEEEMTDEEISAYLKRMSVWVYDKLVLAKSNETLKSTKSITYYKTIPYSMLVDYIENKIYGKELKWSLVYDGLTYRIRFKGKILNFRDYDLADYAIGDCLASFICYLKMNNYIEV